MLARKHSRVLPIDASGVDKSDTGGRASPGPASPGLARRPTFIADAPIWVNSGIVPSKAKGHQARFQKGTRRRLENSLTGVQLDGQAGPFVATVMRQQGEVHNLMRSALRELDRLQNAQLQSLEVWCRQQLPQPAAQPSSQTTDDASNANPPVPAKMPPPGPTENPPPLFMRGDRRAFSTPGGAQDYHVDFQAAASASSSKSSSSAASGSESSSSSEELEKEDAPAAPLLTPKQQDADNNAAAADSAAGTHPEQGLHEGWASARALPWTSDCPAERTSEREKRPTTASEDKMSAIVPQEPKDDQPNYMQSFVHALGRMGPPQQLTFLNSHASFTEEDFDMTAHLQKSRTTSVGRPRMLWKSLRHLVQMVVQSWHFTCCCSAMIMANSVYIGVQWQVQLEAERHNQDMPTIWKYLEASFCAWFSLELLLRMIAYGWRFVSGKDWRWNMFDACLVINCLGEQALEGITPNLSFIRVLRIFRMARVLRIIRVMRFFRALRLMVYSIMHSMLSLLWVFLLLALMMYVFTICFMFAVESYLRRDDAEQDPVVRGQLLAIFGNVPKAMLTLFQTVSGGRDWREVTDPLLEVHWGCVVIFILYIFFIVFGVLNVVTGAFVDSIRLVSSRDRDAVVEEELRRQNDYIAALRLIFAEADIDGSGTLTWEEFEDHLQDFRVKAYFSTLELDVSHAKALFLLLDVDETNEVEIDEFVEGCLRLKGGAKSIDVNMLLYENEKLIGKLAELGDYVEDKFVEVEEALGIQCRKKAKKVRKVKKGMAHNRLDQAVNMMQMVKAASGDNLEDPQSPLPTRPSGSDSQRRPSGSMQNSSVRMGVAGSQKSARQSTAGISSQTIRSSKQRLATKERAEAPPPPAPQRNSHTPSGEIVVHPY